jgi:hypothetical protein
MAGDLMIKHMMFAALAFLASATQAQATEIIGDTISCQQVGSGSSFACNPFETTVGGGAEFYLMQDSQNTVGLNFVADGLTIRNVSGGPMVLFTTIVRLENISQLFSGARLSNSTIFGFNANDISLSDGVLSLDFRNTFWDRNDVAHIRLDAISAVPEPSTWMMLVLGLGAIAGVMRLQRRGGQHKRESGVLAMGRRLV